MIWLEIRCEGRGEGDTGCYSDENCDPAIGAAETNRDVLHALKLLRKSAREEGWRLTKQGWMCPDCLKRAALAKARGEGER